jgi:hypothetical protein
MKIALNQNKNALKHKNSEGAELFTKIREHFTNSCSPDPFPYKELNHDPQQY